MSTDSSRKPERTPASRGSEGRGLGELLSLLSRRRFIWLPIFLIMLTVSVVDYMTSPVFYRSTSRVRVSRGERESSLSARVRVKSWEEELASEVETVFSEPVLSGAEGILEEKGIREENGDPVLLRAAQVGAAPVRGSDVLELIYQHRKPELAREGVSALTLSYMDFRREIQAAPVVDEYFEDEILEVKRRLDDLNTERTSILIGAGISDLRDEREEIVATKGSVRRNLIAVAEQLALSRQRIAGVRAFRASGLEDAAYVPSFTDNEARDETGVRRLTSTLIELQTRENELASRYTDAYPELKEIRGQIEGHKKLVSVAMDRYEGVLLSDQDNWLARQTQLEREFESMDDELILYPAREARLSQINLEISALQENYRQLMNGHTAAGIQNVSAPSWNVRLYQSASDPSRVHTGDLIRTLIVPMFALLLGFGVAFVVDAMDPTVKTTHEAEEIFGAPVLATMGRMGRK